MANVYSETLCERLSEAKIEGKTKVVLYGESYIKFIIKYACNEVGLEFVQKEVSDKVLLNDFCLVGELNDENLQNVAIKNGCISLLDILKK